jgi:hypothetical protein
MTYNLVEYGFHAQTTIITNEHYIVFYFAFGVVFRSQSSNITSHIKSQMTTLFLQVIR